MKARYNARANKYQRAFTIKRLQDAYDCDLDLSDTVGAIFEGETDPSRRMIKVVPSYIHRDFSVPVTSKLIPGHLQQARKRHRESSEGRANKRQRSELRQLEDAPKDTNATRDQPIPSTESDHNEEEAMGNIGATDQLRRSQSERSLVFVNGGQTGHAEFGLDIKAESQELGHPPEDTAAATTATSQGQSLTEPLVPESQPPPPVRQASKARSSIPHASSEDIPIPQFDDEVLETDYLGSDDTHMRDIPEPVEQEVAVSPEMDTQQAVINQSPQSTPQAPEITTPARAAKRRDVYDVPSSPEFILPSSKSKKTYSRSPHNSKMLQKGADLLNQSRLLSAGTNVQKSIQKPLSAKAHAFRPPKPDDIESTPREVASNSQQQSSAEDVDDQEDLTNTLLDEIIRETPNRSTSTRSAKPGSLKKPTIKPQPLTPAQARRNVKLDGSKNAAEVTPVQQRLNVRKNITPMSANGSKEAKLTPKNRARLASLQEKVRRSSSLSAKPKASSPKVVIQSTSRPNSSHSESEANAGKEVPTSAQIQPIEESTQNNNPLFQSKELASRNAAQSSVQVTPSQKTPIKSPVPLPSNVRSATSSDNAVSKNDAQATGNAATFKKPAPRLSSSLTQEQSSQSSDRRRSTPLRNEIPLAGDSKQLAKPTSNVPIRHLSGSSNSERTPIRSEVPLPPNVRRSMSTTSPQAAQHVNSAETTHRSNASAKTSTPAVTSVKRRGRASQISVSSPTPGPETTPAAQRTADSKTAKTTSAASSVATPVAKADAEQPHVISSGESSTDYSDSEEEEEEPQKSTQDLTGTAGNQASQAEQANRLSGGAVVQNGVDAQDETAQKIAPWNTQSWGFQGLDPFNSTSNQSNEEPKSGQAEESANSESEAGAEADTKSRSESAAASTRSSPVVSRAPARFLSHTPTPDASESEDEVEETSIAPPKTVPTNTEPESETDTSSDEEEEEEEEDIEMPDVSVEPSSGAVPSSPPSRKPPPSTPFVPETSQIPAPHHGSSQSVSAQASDRRRRPTARGGYGSYKTITEQLKMVENQPLTQKKVFDPRTVNLTSLLNGKKAGSQVANKPPSQIVFGVGLENDSDESSSSSSDSDSD